MNRLLKILRNKWFLSGMGLLVAYTLAGFLLAPYLTRRFVPQIIHDQLGKQAVIGKVRINPFIFTFEVNDFRMDEPDGQLLAGCKQLFVDFEMSSIFKWAWTFRQVSLQEPTVHLVIEPDGSFSLAKLAPPATTPLGRQRTSIWPLLIALELRLRHCARSPCTSPTPSKGSCAGAKGCTATNSTSPVSKSRRESGTASFASWLGTGRSRR